MIEGLEHLPPMTLMLVSAIIWLSGLFVWLIKRFVDSFEKNTEVIDAIDRKLDTSADRDLETVKMLEKIHARQIDPPSVNVVMPDNMKANGSR